MRLAWTNKRLTGYHKNLYVGESIIERQSVSYYVELLSYCETAIARIHTGVKRLSRFHANWRLLLDPRLLSSRMWRNAEVYRRFEWKYFFYIYVRGVKVKKFQTPADYLKLLCKLFFMYTASAATAPEIVARLLGRNPEVGLCCCHLHWS
jgi:hypothetical protein